MTTEPYRGLVLVIDDEPINIHILTSILEDDCEIIFATSGEAALDLLKTCQPDLILLDVRMPGMDGYAVCNALKQARATAGIPVIFVTGNQDAGAEAECLDMGAVDYVTKPLNAKVVRARVRNQVEMKHLRDELRNLAVTDGLTGLANRRHFDDTLAVEYRRLARSRGWLSLMMVDVDHFKAFNDHYGHTKGDDCLRRIAKAMSSLICRAADLPARYGGEEFVCVLPETGLIGAGHIAERLRASIVELQIPHLRSDAASFVTTSIGVATGRCLPGDTPLAILAAADKQLYAAKAGGRNQIRSVLLE